MSSGGPNGRRPGGCSSWATHSTRDGPIGVACFDLATGSLRWSDEFDGRLEAGPVVVDDLVVYSENRLRAVDRHDDDLVWSLPKNTSFTDIVAAAGDLLLAVDRDGVWAVRSNGDGGVWLWTPRERVVSPPVAGGDRAFVVTSDGTLVALSVDDGVVEWRQSFPGLHEPPVLFDDHLYVGTTNGVERVRVDGTGRELVWGAPGVDEGIMRRLLVGGETLYGFDESVGGFAISLPDGTLEWTSDSVQGVPVPGRRHLFSATDGRGVRAYRSS